jgi:hypothetical protein
MKKWLESKRKRNQTSRVGTSEFCVVSKKTRFPQRTAFLQLGWEVGHKPARNRGTRLSTSNDARGKSLTSGSFEGGGIPADTASYSEKETEQEKSPNEEIENRKKSIQTRTRKDTSIILAEGALKATRASTRE